MSQDYRYLFFFNVCTNLTARERCKSVLSSRGLVWRKSQNFEDYLHTLRSHKFAVCPIGNGITHRFWECILLGARVEKVYPQQVQ